MNHKKYWFRQKKYGYGVTPCSAEGWLVTLGLAIYLVSVVQYLFTTNKSQPKKTLILCLIIVAISSFLFLHLTKSRTKGNLKWRWGERD